MLFTELNVENKRELLALARTAIKGYLCEQVPMRCDLDHYESALTQIASCFVTLKDQQGELRGCIGGLQARQALVQDVADHAIAAASRDTRFSPLKAGELEYCSLEISVLTPLVPLAVESEDALLDALVVGEDGLLIEEGPRRATFLPKVWAQLSDKKQFLEHLKIKAGMSEDYWSKAIKCFRYRAVDFAE